MSISSIAPKPVTQIPPVQEVFRLLLDTRQFSVEFATTMVNFLSREKQGQFGNVNFHLETLCADAGDLLDEIENFQSFLESIKTTKRDLSSDYLAIKGKVDEGLFRLNASKEYLDQVKMALCRFILQYESPNHRLSREYSTVEEAVDAATLAEMRLARNVQPDSESGTQRFLALFMTFRSIVCAFNGPSFYIAQLHGAQASLDAIFQKVRLEMEVFQATQKLMETRQELTAMRFNMTALQTQLMEKKDREERLKQFSSLQDKSGLPALLLSMMAVVMILGGAAWYYWDEIRLPGREADPVISQKSCLDIKNQLEASPRYNSQVLIFRKYGNDIYFKANHLTCEKLHRLDSTQISALALLLKDDYAAGNREVGTFNGNRVLQVKDIGIHKLVVRLSNDTRTNPGFKAAVLERAAAMQAMLHREDGTKDPDLLVVELTRR